MFPFLTRWALEGVPPHNVGAAGHALHPTNILALSSPFLTPLPMLLDPNLCFQFRLGPIYGYAAVDHDPKRSEVFNLAVPEPVRGHNGWLGLNLMGNGMAHSTT